MRQTITFDGTIMLESPYATCPPDTKNPDDSQPLPRLTTYDGGREMSLPYIPGGQFKGKLRRAIAEHLATRFKEAGEEVQFEDWLLWTVGGVKGTAKTNIDPRERNAIIEANPVLSVFGAGASAAGGMVGARLSCGHALPRYEPTTSWVKGTRSHEDKSPLLLEALSISEMGKVALYSAANHDRSALQRKKRQLEGDLRKLEAKARAGEAGDEAVLDRLKNELEEVTSNFDHATEAQAKLGVEVAIGRPLPGYEVMPAGLELTHRMQLKAASEIEAGFFLQALAGFAEDPIMGAHVTAGNGRVAGQYSVSARQRGQEPTLVGALSFSEASALVIEGEVIQGWLTTWQEATPNLDHIRAAPSALPTAA